MKKTVVLCVLIAATACERAEDVPELQADSAALQDQPAVEGAGAVLVVAMRNANGDSVGAAVLRGREGGVDITLTASGLPPGEHGFHIHETGACEPPAFESAGAHFSPEAREHGAENPNGPHAGDLPNVLVGAAGNAQATAVAQNVNLLRGDSASLLDADGSALVLHAGPDDYATDPDGNSGAGIACGVVE
ncbi:MAG: superoxide dismutase family protein [Gemmatimonadota bacterium]